MAKRPETPTPEILQQLPVNACVAFAARCAGRLFPIIDGAPGGEESLLAKRFQRAVAFAVAIGAGEKKVDAFQYYKSLSLDGDDLLLPRPDALTMTQHAAMVAARAAILSVTGDSAGRMNIYANAAIAADAASSAIHLFLSNKAQQLIDGAMWRDYELLCALGQAENWTDSTPVHPDLFGPLWPEGVPEGWPKEETSEGAELVLDIELAEDATDANVLAAVRKLTEALDDVHRAYGGHGLKVDSIEILGEVPVPEEVPQ